MRDAKQWDWIRLKNIYVLPVDNRNLFAYSRELESKLSLYRINSPLAIRSFVYSLIRTN